MSERAQRGQKDGVGGFPGAFDSWLLGAGKRYALFAVLISARVEPRLRRADDRRARAKSSQPASPPRARIMPLAVAAVVVV